MLTLSKWIILYGVGLITYDCLDASWSVDLGLHGRTLICGWVGGIIMVAAGLAADQRRRSLRLGGLYVSVALAIAMVGFFAWDATDSWMTRSRVGGPIVIAVVPTIWIALTLSLLAIITRLRPREGIASRGYAVPLPPKPRITPAVQAVPEKRHSSAG
jgi:hypothetical protein